MNNINNLLEYINKSPENTNPAIVKSIIESEYDSGDFEPETVTGEGDVSITYNGNQIGVLSDSGTLTLDTEGKVVEHDIEVEYTKNAPAGNIVNITNNTSDTINMTGSGLVTPEGVSDNVNFEILSIQPGNSSLFLYNNHINNEYIARFFIKAQSNRYSIIVNNTPIPYDERGLEYRFSQTSQATPITGQTYNVVVNNK